ncbi:efflux RND transporter periplasmic adaptor subunit [Ammonifex degensii]|uniref:efflux RND transporter periplasmic adaptor subunit n=1 Tax=Ammonifex degensii TaxID=42838 RepID=UPI00059D0909|nr:efflux RND transporter periplasmic adaptor subunit [Ammonifex degensii]
MATGALIVTIQQPSRNWADFKVNEKLVSKFKEGQEVKISSPDLPGKTFTGKVESINRKPDYAARRPTHERGEKELVAYNVKVRLDNPELRAGMTVILHLP